MNINRNHEIIFAKSENAPGLNENGTKYKVM